MQKIAFACGALLLALGACSDADEAEELVVADEPMEEDIAVAPDGRPVAGTFRVTAANGEVWTQVINPDGTVDSTAPDGTRSAGAWTSSTPGRFCMTAEGENEQTCYAEAVAEDGTWTSTNEANPEDTYTVERVS